MKTTIQVKITMIFTIAEIKYQAASFFGHLSWKMYGYISLNPINKITE